MHKTIANKNHCIINPILASEMLAKNVDGTIPINSPQARIKDDTWKVNIDPKTKAINATLPNP